MSNRRLLIGLGLSQTVGYGVLYYAFSVFLTPMTRALHASAVSITLAFTLAMLVSAAAAIPVGRWLDRRGGHGLMTGGSILAVASVLAWSQVTNVGQLYGVFVLLGLASAAVLYEAAFAVIIAATRAAERSSSLLAVTIVAGFASTIFLPMSGLLVHNLGWRQALVVLAVVLGVVTVSAHAFTISRIPRPVPARTDSRIGNQPSGTVALALRDRGFWLLTMGFVTQGAATATISVLLVTYLTTLGHSAQFAASVAGLLGVLSVTGRLITNRIGRRHATAATTALVFALQAVAIGALPAVGRSGLGAVACVVLFGFGFGVATLARPMLLAERYGTVSYASIAGTLTLPMTVAKAGAPLGAAALLTISGSYIPMVAALVVCCTVAALSIAAVGWLPVPVGGSISLAPANANGHEVMATNNASDAAMTSSVPRRYNAEAVSNDALDSADTSSEVTGATPAELYESHGTSENDDLGLLPRSNRK